jgi:hypothetical protein
MKTKARLLASAALVVLVTGGVAVADMVSSTNVLDSAAIASGSPPRRVTLAGHYIPGTHIGVGTCEISGRTVTGYATKDSTTTTLSPTTTTTVTGTYALTSTTQLANNSTYGITTVVQGFMGGGYQGTHGCLDATSNSINVTT